MCSELSRGSGILDGVPAGLIVPFLQVTVQARREPGTILYTVRTLSNVNRQLIWDDITDTNPTTSVQYHAQFSVVSYTLLMHATAAVVLSP